MNKEQFEIMNKLSKQYAKTFGYMDKVGREEDYKAGFRKALTLTDVSQRYFIVSYIANVVRGSMTGNLDVVTNGEYLNRVLTTENIRESIKQDCSDIVITNIIELSKIDYESWSSNVG